MKVYRQTIRHSMWIRLENKECNTNTYRSHKIIILKQMNERTERRLVAPESAILLVFQVLSDGEDVLPRAAQVAREYATLRLREQIRELVDPALEVAVRHARTRRR